MLNRCRDRERIQYTNLRSQSALFKSKIQNKLKNCALEVKFGLVGNGQCWCCAGWGSIDRVVLCPCCAVQIFVVSFMMQKARFYLNRNSNVLKVKTYWTFVDLSSERTTYIKLCFVLCDNFEKLQVFLKTFHVNWISWVNTRYFMESLSPNSKSPSSMEGEVR